jgi:hypothetical protein
MRQALKLGVARASRAISPTGQVAVYVPRRFKLGALDGVPLGAAIVGTPQTGGKVAIDFQATEWAAPSLHTWSGWVADAACRLCDDEGDWRRTEAFERELRLVGYYEDDQVTVLEEGRAVLWRWIDVGKLAYTTKAAPLIDSK